MVCSQPVLQAGNYTVSDGMLPILSNILGLLTAAAPLQSLRFIGSAVPPRLLPIMQSLPSLTRCMPVLFIMMMANLLHIYKYVTEMHKGMLELVLDTSRCQNLFLINREQALLDATVDQCMAWRNSLARMGGRHHLAMLEALWTRRLEIGVVAGPPGDMLNVALSRLTGLQELTVVVRLAIHHPDNSTAAWPSNLRHCTRLRCSHLLISPPSPSLPSGWPRGCPWGCVVLFPGPWSPRLHIVCEILQTCSAAPG